MKKRRWLVSFFISKKNYKLTPKSLSRPNNDRLAYLSAIRAHHRFENLPGKYVFFRCWPFFLMNEHVCWKWIHSWLLPCRIPNVSLQQSKPVSPVGTGRNPNGTILYGSRRYWSQTVRPLSSRSVDYQKFHFVSSQKHYQNAVTKLIQIESGHSILRQIGSVQLQLCTHTRLPIQSTVPLQKVSRKSRLYWWFLTPTVR